MPPLLIVSPPRAKSSLLCRMLGLPVVDADDFLSAVRALHGSQPGGGAAWDAAIGGLWAGRGSAAARATFLGREGWGEAFGWWSWFLETVPGGRIVFLSRDQGEIELSMEATRHLRWVPRYGSCGTCTGARVKEFLQAMADFHALNPARTSLLDAAALADFPATSAALARLGVPLDRATWERELATVIGSHRQLQPPPQAPGDPFHPYATAADIPPPVGAAWDPFAPGVAGEDVIAHFPAAAPEPEPVLLPPDYLPRPPRPFRIQPTPRVPRAIVYPWLSRAAVWEELRYSLRSVEEHFTDRECPVYIVGDAPPPWLVPGGRVRWIECPGYQRSDRRGFFEARVKGLQLAEEILWMNDDFYLLKNSNWDTFRTALTCGHLDHRAARLREKSRDFLRGKGSAGLDLMFHGRGRLLDFAVHAPLLFERRRALEILRRFHIGHRGGFANLYHNWHRTPHQPARGLVTTRLPAPHTARTLYHLHEGPDSQTAALLAARFPAPGRYERAFDTAARAC